MRLFNISLLTGIAWYILQSGHELLGHGLSTILVGGTPLGVNAMYFLHDLSEVSWIGIKFVQAAGSLFNILFAVLCWFLLQREIFKDYWVRFFLWISMMINLMQSGSYVAFGRFIHEGMDWAKIIEDLEPYSLWANVTLFAGFILIISGIYLGRKFQSEFIGIKQRSTFLIILSTTNIVSTISSFIIPTDDRFMMIMGGIGNGFTFLFPLLILAFWKQKFELVIQSEPKLSTPWIITGVVIIGFYLGVMSPGIEF
jgi:hypothetical protein